MKRPGARPAAPTDWDLVPGDDADLEAIARHCRQLVKRRALWAAGVAALPLPGLDWLTDLAVLMKLLPDINKAFGLSNEQIERLAPDRRVVVYKAISAGGGLLIGKVITHEVVMRVLRVAGVRLTAQQAAKVVPVAGQVVSAALTYGALKLVCEQHIRQCMEVARQLQLPAPSPLPG
jgi:uncharacterized protein (DUF697 family)